MNIDEFLESMGEGGGKGKTVGKGKGGKGKTVEKGKGKKLDTVIPAPAADPMEEKPEAKGKRGCRKPMFADRSHWDHVRATAIALGSLKEAAEVHGVTYASVKLQASNHKWGFRQTMGALRKNTVHIPTSGEVLSAHIRETGQMTRHMLAKALLHGAGQAQKTKHPLAKSRNINELATAAAKVHGWDKEDNSGSIVVPIQVNVDIG